MATTVHAALTPLAIDWQTPVKDGLSSIATFVPKLLVFLLILFVAWLVAKGVAKFLGLVLGRLGFNALLAKAGADDVLRGAQIEPIGLITKLAYYFILLIGLQLALSAFGPTNPVSQLVDKIVLWLPQAFVAIVIVIIAGAVANAVKDLLTATLGGVSYGPLLAKIAAGFIIALGVIAALNQIGIGTAVTLPVLITVLATVGGILVVGVGGGLIGPMRNRWEGWLNQISADAAASGQHGQHATSSYDQTRF
jgi:hypothetical protein